MTHPSALKIVREACPKALDFYENGTPYDRRIFEPGIAAHAVLQAVGEHGNKSGAEVSFETARDKIAPAVAAQLIAKGRSFDDTPEPPLDADRVWAGVKIALDYLLANPLPVGPQFEVGLAVNEKWEPCEYKGGWLQHIADYVETVEELDEESALAVVVSNDYKSAWPTSEGELDSLQSKVRALLVVAHHPKAEILSHEVTNIRTHATYRRRYWLQDPGTLQMFADWRLEIETTMQAYNGPRVAAPGFGCYACRYLTACEAGRDLVQRAALSDDPRTVAEGFCAAQGLRDTLKAHLEQLTSREAVELERAWVGHHHKSQRKPIDGAALQAWEDWELNNGEARGFIQAAGLGVGNLAKVAKALQPGARKPDVDKYLDGLTELVRVKRFDIHKKGKA